MSVTAYKVHRRTADGAREGKHPGVATPPTRLTGMMVTARVADSGLSSMVP